MDPILEGTILPQFGSNLGLLFERKRADFIVTTIPPPFTPLMSSTEQLSVAERAFGYRPNRTLAILAAVVYAGIFGALLFKAIRSKMWWGLSLPIGALLEGMGFGLRYLSKSNPDSVGLFAIEELLIICAPALFLAFNYVTYGRLISYAGAQHSIVNPRRVAIIFVASDVFTFLLQAGGSGLQTSDKFSKTGQTIVLVGLVLQAVSYGFFCILLVKSHISIKSSGPYQTHRSCIRLIQVLYFSSVFISIRCIYRIVEYAQGDGGYLLTHEAFLYALDTLPLIVAIVIYVPFWPAKYIEQDHGMPKDSLEMTAGLRP